MNDDTTTDRSFIERLYATITQHLSDEQYSVEELSRELGVSKTQLHRKLQLHTGKSASQLIREARLEKAKELLENNITTVAEVAYLVGFKSPTYFNTCFHDFFGYPPGVAKFKGKEVQRPILTKKIAIISASVLCFIVIVYFSMKLIPNTKNIIPAESMDYDNSIALVAFENLSSSDEQDYLCKGMEDAILNHLVRIGDLKIIDGRSSSSLKNTDLTINEIVKKHSVSNILTGSVLKAGNEVRINIRLKEARTGVIIWSDIYEGNLSDLSNIFVIQADVAQNVSNRIKAKLTAKLKEVIQPISITRNSLAYEFYLKGNYAWYKGLSSTRKLALDMYTKAILEDSLFVAAYARRALTHLLLYWMTFEDRQEHLAKAKQDLNKGFQLDSESLELKLVEAVSFYYMDRNYKKSIKHLNELKKEAPNMPDLYAYVSFNLRRQGKFWESILEMKKAIQLDPFNEYYYDELIDTYEILHEYDSAINLSRYVLLFNPGNLSATYHLFTLNIKKEGDLSFLAQENNNLEMDYECNIHYYKKEYEESIDCIKNFSRQNLNFRSYRPKTYEIALNHFLSSNVAQCKIYTDSAISSLKAEILKNPDTSPLYATLGKCYAFLGNNQEAISNGEKAIQLLPITLDAFWGTDREVDLIEIYILTGNYNLALEKIEYLLSIPSFLSIGVLQIDPIYDPLHNLPRFQEIVKSGLGHASSLQ